MAKQTINIGAVANDGTGDPIRDAFDKTNDNFDEVYSAFVFASNNATFANTLNSGNSTVNVAINSSSFAMSTNTMTVGSSSVAANGYSVLPNGLLIQWGHVAANSSVGDITFSTAFATLYSVQITGNNSAYDSTYLPLIIQSNTTTANVRTANTTAVNVTYFAIGNTA